MIRILADTRNAKQHWDRRGDELPYLMVPMSDGSTVRYNPEIKQPSPVLREPLDRYTKLCIGYERSNEHDV